MLVDNQDCTAMRIADGDKPVFPAQVVHLPSGIAVRGVSTNFLDEGGQREYRLNTLLFGDSFLSWLFGTIQSCIGSDFFLKST